MENDDDEVVINPDLKAGQIRFSIADRHEELLNNVAEAALAAFYSESAKSVQVFVSASASYTAQTKINLFMELGNACIAAAANAARDIAAREQPPAAATDHANPVDAADEKAIKALAGGKTNLTNFPSRGNNMKN